jgi:predicted metal-dependent peptidase
MNVGTKIEAAIERLLLYHPLFAFIALQIPLVPNESISCKMQTNGVTIEYKPSYVESATVQDVELKIAHEIAHIILMHTLRVGNFDFETYNEAADYAINLLLFDSGFPVNQTNTLLDFKYAGQSSEEIYKQIFEEKENEKEQDSNESNQEEENPDSNENGNGESESESESESDEDNGDEDGNGEDGGDNGEDGGESDQDNQSSEAIDEDSPSNDGRVLPAPTDISHSELEDKLTQMIVESAMQAEMAGALPGGLKAVIDALKEPKQDWRDILRHFASEVSANDYDWQTPDLNYLQRDVYIPSLNDLSLGGIAFAIDTSISVNDELLKEFLTELKDIASLFTNDVLVIHCDTEVRLVEEVAEEDIESIEPVGRGGTSFLPVFNFIEENDIHPKALVYFTDGKCRDELTEPDYPVIWCIYENKNFTPKFGEVIHVD